MGTLAVRTMFVCSLCQQEVKKNVSKRVQLMGSAGYDYLTILEEFGGDEFPREELRALLPAKALLCYDCQCSLKKCQTICAELGVLRESIKSKIEGKWA